MLSALLVVSARPRARYGPCASTAWLTHSSKKICDVNSYVAEDPSNFLILKWMWIARPEYQPGYTVVNCTAPFASVT
jgi:hypothetical protein